ncbi:MAG: hypothetical protein IKS51_00595 [Erysipelotrichaceae bacterium]|nr:hypothetical protein [Erysipelotrichaceae bacterium]
MNNFDLRETVRIILEEKTEEEKLFLYSDHCQLYDEYPSLLKRKLTMLQDAYAFLYEDENCALYHVSEEEAAAIIKDDIDGKDWKIMEGALISERYRVMIHDHSYRILSSKEKKAE